MVLWLRFTALCFLLFSAFASAAVTPWFSFTLYNGHITLPVTVNGIKTNVVLDSGAMINGINTAFIKANHMQLSKGSAVLVKGAFGTKRQQSFNDVGVELMGAHWQMDHLVSVALGDKNLGLLLGAGFFDKFIFQIDYPNQRMRLITRDSLDMNRYSNIEMRTAAGGFPIVKTKLNDQKSVWLVLDTGNSGGLLLSHSLVQAQGWLKTFASQQVVAQGVNNKVLNDTFRLPVLTFGPYQVENVAVTVPTDGRYDATDSLNDGSALTRIDNARVRGLLGFDVIKHFVLTIDYKNGRMNVAVPTESSTKKNRP